MQYKTIVLELLEQRPQIHEQLKASRTLLSTTERLATLLKNSHHEWKHRLRQASPGSSPEQIADEALEPALKELEAVLSSVSLEDEDEP
jgi:hypothetical protein